MKTWNLKVDENAKSIISKMQSMLGSNSGLVIGSEKDNLSFRIGKRVTYPDQILHRNRIVVNGKISSGDTEKESHIRVDFSPHYFMKLTVLSIIIAFIGMLVVIFKIISGMLMYLSIGLLAALMLALWMALQKKYHSDIKAYKELLSEIFES